MSEKLRLPVKTVEAFGYKLKKSTMICEGYFALQGHARPIILPIHRKVCILLSCKMPRFIIKDPKGLGLDHLHSCLLTMRQVRENHK